MARLTGKHGLSEPFGFQAVAGQVRRVSVVHKFGHNHTVGTSFVPVSVGGVWPTPQITGATTLRIQAGGDAADDAAGLGAQEIEIQGLDTDGNETSATLATAGASASASTTQVFMRVFRVVVTKTGTYATATATSHAAEITIENTAGTEDWFTIEHNDGIGRSQSQIGSYTVPLGKTAYIAQFQIDVDSGKTVDVLFFQRRNILETAPPYSAMRIAAEFVGVQGSIFDSFEYHQGPFPALTDIGYMAKVASGTASVSVDFAIILVDDDAS